MSMNLEDRIVMSTLGTLLGRRRTLLTNRIGDDAQDPITDHPADFLTQATLGNIQETSLTLRDKQFQSLRNIDAAIERVNNGGYGICAECSLKIERKRLDAFPEAALCLSCKEIEEINEKNAPQEPLLFFEAEEDVLLSNKL